jgi:signal transduction histidine kinase
LTRRGLTVTALRAGRARRTVRLRLTLWSGGLFLICGTVLLAVTYGLVVQAFIGNSASNAECRAPGSGCSTIGPQQARAMALQEHAAVLHELLTRSEIALAVTGVLSVALGWFIAGRVLRPLRTITAAARGISAASLGERLALGGPRDELRELGDTFDGLLARLEASFTAQRQFIANASHELRTPLARQRVISQVALADPGATIETLRAAHERVLASGAQQEQLIEALLTLARGQAGLDKQEPLDLAALTRQVLAGRGSEAEHRNLTLHADLRPARAAGSPRLAERLAANLVDNALRHNVPGGRIDVTTSTRNSRAVLCVANTGTAIPAAAVDRLFQPFQRLGTDRTSRGEGTGLGLSIVQAIADAHSASITARPQPGGGMLVEVTFPDPRTEGPAQAVPGNPHARITAAATCKPRLADAGTPQAHQSTESPCGWVPSIRRPDSDSRASSLGNQKPRDAMSKDPTTDKPEHWL